MRTILALVAVLTGGYVGYEIILNEKQFSDIVAPLQGNNQVIIDKIMGILDEIIPAGSEQDIAETVVEMPSIENMPVEETMPMEELQPQPAETILPVFDIRNPYWGLPNSYVGDPLAMSRHWTPQEEQIWQSGITHHFPYQQYKTVHDVVAERLSGSEIILYDALFNDKFWTRMWALIGLASFGSKIDLDVVIRSIGNARESLVVNFFKRFVHDSSPAELYVMRYAIRTVSPRARKIILSALLNSNDDFNTIYLAAATFDQDTSIAKWANKQHQAAGHLLY